eukprot:scaffold11460_cov64-Phaeocystis_antarctica.AAC.10
MSRRTDAAPVNSRSHPRPTLPISAHRDPPPIPARPRSLRSAQQVRHVPSPHGVSQHEQEGPGSSGAEEEGAAGA